MPPREWKLRVEDILEAIGRIEGYVADLDYVRFAHDRRTVDAVVRNFGVIGEAARHVPTEVQARYPEIPWLDMRAMRNFVVHEYFGVSDRILWDTACSDLPPLIQQLQRMLEPES